MYFAAWIRERPIDIAAHSRSCSQRAQSHALRADDALAGCRRLLATLAACQRPQATALGAADASTDSVAWWRGAMCRPDLLLCDLGAEESRSGLWCW